MKSICILICYYGSFPWYFPYFLHSCTFNSTIEFIIFTDIKYNGSIPDNVIFVKKSIEEIKVLASKKLKLNADIDFAYKLCDFKPAYGLIFSDYIEDYDFWGQSDINVIYGSIRSFLTNEILNEFDFINVRHDYTTGCFALYRNNDFVNKLFKRSKDYKKVFTSSKHYCFDECNFTQPQLTDGKSIFEVETEIERLHPHHKISATKG